MRRQICSKSFLLNLRYILELDNNSRAINTNNLKALQFLDKTGTQAIIANPFNSCGLRTLKYTDQDSRIQNICTPHNVYSLPQRSNYSVVTFCTLEKARLIRSLLSVSITSPIVVQPPTNPSIGNCVF